jgi:hypothetical protein
MLAYATQGDNSPLRAHPRGGTRRSESLWSLSQCLRHPVTDRSSGYEGYAIVASNAHLQVYPQENDQYETRDALACAAA